MLAAVILSATLATAEPAQPPAWEALACTYCTVDGARVSGWSFDAARSERGPRAWADYTVPETMRGQRFATQRQCLAALRRSLPAVTAQTDARGQITTRRHRRDHITETQDIPGAQSGSALYGCFQHAQPIG